jgi:hypothetical protein
LGEKVKPFAEQNISATHQGPYCSVRFDFYWRS